MLENTESLKIIHRKKHNLDATQDRFNLHSNAILESDNAPATANQSVGNYKIVATEKERGYFGLIYADIGLEHWP